MVLCIAVDAVWGYCGMCGMLLAGVGRLWYGVWPGSLLKTPADIWRYHALDVPHWWLIGLALGSDNNVMLTWP